MVIKLATCILTRTCGVRNCDGCLVGSRQDLSAEEEVLAGGRGDRRVHGRTAKRHCRHYLESNRDEMGYEAFYGFAPRMKSMRLSIRSLNKSWWQYFSATIVFKLPNRARSLFSLYARRSQTSSFLLLIDMLLKAKKNHLYRWDYKIILRLKAIFLVFLAP